VVDFRESCEVRKKENSFRCHKTTHHEAIIKFNFIINFIMRVLFNIFACLLLIDTVAGQCSLCPGGSSSLINPGAKLGQQTCEDVEARLSPIPSAVCNAMTLGENFHFDYSAFCCADVKSSTPSCDICSPGYVILQENIQTPANNLVSTCGEALLAANYAESSASCNVLQEAGVDCCEPVDPTEAPTSSPTSAPTKAPPTASTSNVEPEEEEVPSINAAEEQLQSAAAGVSFMAVATLGLVLSSFV
jgi:hypothetical protein